MGLDTVELLMKVEQYFDLTVPDAKAEKIYTVQSFVDEIAGQLNITDCDAPLRSSVLQEVDTALLKLEWIQESLNFEDKISNYLLPAYLADWGLFEKELELKIPFPALADLDQNSLLSKIRRAFNWKPHYDWRSVSVREFVDAICFENFRTLIVKDWIRNQYEIYVVIAGITCEVCGIDVYEIEAQKSFTKDLGID